MRLRRMRRTTHPISIQLHKHRSRNRQQRKFSSLMIIRTIYMQLCMVYARFNSAQTSPMMAMMRLSWLRGGTSRAGTPTRSFWWTSRCLSALASSARSRSGSTSPRAPQKTLSSPSSAASPPTTASRTRLRPCRVAWMASCASPFSRPVWNDYSKRSDSCSEQTNYLALFGPRNIVTSSYK